MSNRSISMKEVTINIQKLDESILQIVWGNIKNRLLQTLYIVCRSLFDIHMLLSPDLIIFYLLTPYPICDSL